MRCLICRLPTKERIRIFAASQAMAQMGGVIWTVFPPFFNASSATCGSGTSACGIRDWVTPRKCGAQRALAPDRWRSVVATICNLTRHLFSWTCGKFSAGAKWYIDQTSAFSVWLQRWRVSRLSSQTSTGKLRRQRCSYQGPVSHTLTARSHKRPHKERRRAWRGSTGAARHRPRLLWRVRAHFCQWRRAIVTSARSFAHSLLSSACTCAWTCWTLRCSQRIRQSFCRCLFLPALVSASLAQNSDSWRFLYWRWETPLRCRSSASQRWARGPHK